MALWGNVDNAANSDIAALMQVSARVSTSERTRLYGNVTRGAFQSSNVIVGQFGVGASEIRAMNADVGGAHPQHAGWVLRREGTGLRAGRVTYETLVAMGSMSGDGADDTYIPDYAIVIGTQPLSNTSATRGNLNFTVVASSVPSGATLQYFWQVNNGGWANVTNTAGQYFSNTSATFTANNVTANGNVFRAMIMTTGGATVFTSNATIRYVV
jgi:hypothetical protein